MRVTRLVLPLVLLVAAAATGCGRAGAAEDLGSKLEEGWRAFSTGDFEIALTQFHAVEGDETASLDEQYSALLGLASTHHLRTNPQLAQAKDYYGRLMRLEHEAASRQGLLGLGLVELAAGNEAEGQTHLTKLISNYPDSIEADEATIHLATTLLKPTIVEAKPGEFDLPRPAAVQRGLKTLARRLETHPHNPLAAAMHVMMANKYIELKQFEEAVEHFIAADEAGIAVTKQRSITLWRIARIAETALKDYGLAEDYYSRYVNEFRRTDLYYRATKSLERVRELKARQGA
ncbi:MAG: tetratricopeptide repeat protein [Planctomycetota bacterium]